MTAYYVSTSGNNGNAGTSSGTAWRTIQYALDSVSAGDTINVAAGTYYEHIAPTVSGSAGNLITVQGPGSGEAVIAGTVSATTIADFAGVSYLKFVDIIFDRPSTWSDPASRWFYIVFWSGSYIELENCTVRRTGRNKYTEFLVTNRTSGIVVVGTAHHIVFDRCEITGVTHGLNLNANEGAHDIHVDACWIHHTIQNCIVIGHSDYNMAGILIEDCTLEYSYFEDGIQWESDFTAVDPKIITPNWGTIVRGCIIRHNAENACDLKGAQYVLIEGNVVYGTIGSDDGDDPIRGTGGWDRNAPTAITRGANRSTSDVIIRNNVIFDNFNGVLADTRYKIYHNLILANNRDYTGSNSTWEQYAYPHFSGVFQQWANKSGIGIRNNIIGGHKYGGQLALRTSGGTFDIDNNIYYTGVGGAAYNTSWVTTSVYTHYTFAQWKAFLAGLSNVTGKDVNSQWLTLGQIQFANVPENPGGAHTLYDFSIATTSPAYQSGLRLTTTTNSGSSSTNLTVADASWFCDGYGCDYASGDTIMVDGVEAVISSISGNTITLAAAKTWSSGADVFWGDSITPHIGLADVTASAPPSDWINASFTYTPTGGNAPLSVTFTDTTTGSGSPSSWSWDFGDGATSTSQSPSHTFSAGTWTITLEASDGTNTDTATVQITVGTAGTGTNLLSNGDFAGGSTGWSFFSSGTASWSAATGAAVVDVTDGGSNTQLWQANISLTAGIQYRLSFEASADATSTMGLAVIQDNSPYASMGLAETVSLTTSPTTFTYDFTPSITEADSRLRFFFNNRQNIEFTIDDVVLSDNSGLVASFTASDSTPTVGSAVTLTDTSTGTPTDWLWEVSVGGGEYTAFASSQDTSYTPAGAGSYAIRLAVEDASANTSSAVTYLTASLPSMVSGQIVAVGRAAANTSTGNQTIDFDEALENAPGAVLFMAARITGDGTADDVSMCIGAGDGTVEWYQAIRHVDNVGTTDPDHISGDDAVIVLLDDTGTTPTVEAKAAWVSATASGVTINWTTAPASAYLVQVMAFDCDAACKIVAVHRTQNSYTDTALSFTPTAAIAVGTRVSTPTSFPGTIYTGSNLSVGMYDGTTQGCVVVGSSHSASTSLSQAYLANNRIGAEIDASSLLSSIEASFTANNLRLTTRDANPSSFNEVGVLVLDTASDDDYSAEVIIDTLPTGTGADTVATSFDPGAVLAVFSNVAAVNTHASDGTAESFSIGIATDNDNYNLGFGTEDGVTTSNEKTSAASTLVHTIDPNDGSDRAKATATMGYDEIELTYTAVDTAAYAVWLAIEGGSGYLPQAVIRRGLHQGLRSYF